ncbi:MAG: Gfo/Idh/MocA family protein [Thermoguttaceae bacterium]
MNTRQTLRNLPRRQFLSGAAAAAVTLVKPSLVSGTAANSAVQLGMIGCGGRGTWIAELFLKSGKYRLAACAEYFEDRLNAFGQRYQVPNELRFSGLSGYKRLLDARLDAVVIETPPGFHPEQAAAAVDAGKHVFVAKPIAVDVPGCQTIGQAGRKATDKGLVFLVDFQTRADPLYQEAIRRVHGGQIGKLVKAEAEYPWSGGGPGVPTTSPEQRLRNWYQHLEFCGDVIVEQDIHALDVATWILDAAPVRAFGTRGRKIRVHGSISDQFSVIYWFPGDLVLTFSSVKCIPGVRDQIRCNVYGTAGMIHTDYFGEVWIRGNKPFEGGRLANLYSTGTLANIDQFHRAIAEGDFANPTVAPSVRSNLTCILGRTAAYKGGPVTWDEMVQANEKIEMDLKGLKA